jgi:RNA polymerase sigma-54 factor
MLKQHLQQKLLQKLSPQQIQLIKLLEIPSIQLEQRIKKEIEENPVLEEGIAKDSGETDEVDEDSVTDSEEYGGEEEVTIEDYVKEETPAYKYFINNYSKDDIRPEIPFSSGSTFHEYLSEQLGLRKVTAHQELLARYLIGDIDDDGYLRRNLDDIVDDLAFSQNISTTSEELEAILEIIQDLEPVGVGARSLRECLLLQINNKETGRPEIKWATDILQFHFEEFTKKHYEKIKRKLNISEEDLKLAINEIIHLNPKPGNSYFDPLNKNSQQIFPDFILEEKDGELILSLNHKNVPDLRINSVYAKMFENYNKKKKEQNIQVKETVAYMKQKIDAAKWFIDAIKQRQVTMMLTMNEIIKFQQEYFTYGDETRLKPMILKDIADRTGLDISTISRVANSKFIQTHFGIFPLKFFFSEGMPTDSGEEVSTREIKKILHNCINNESKRKPLTDEKLAKMLKEKGYQIARRTVAKYREQLDIPVARLRKEL